jgi:acetyl-CoA synthetase
VLLDLGVSEDDDDVITSGAYRIGPFEVESVPVQHPAVVEARRRGRDAQSAQRSSLPSPRCRGLDRVACAGQRAAGFRQARHRSLQIPREIHVVDEMLRTISGKIRRSELRGSLRGRQENS